MIIIFYTPHRSCGVSVSCIILEVAALFLAFIMPCVLSRSPMVLECQHAWCSPHIYFTLLQKKNIKKWYAKFSTFQCSYIHLHVNYHRKTHTSFIKEYYSVSFIPLRFYCFYLFPIHRHMFLAFK